MKKIYILIIMVLVILSCNSTQEYNPFYYYTLVEQEPDNIFVIGNYVDSIENGNFNFFLGDKLLSNGHFDRGARVGIWRYYKEEKEILSVDYCLYQKKETKIKVSYPKDWQILGTSEKYIYQATFNTISDYKNNKYFIILKHDKKSFTNGISDYLNIYKTDFDNNYEIFSRNIYKVFNNNRISHLLRYQFMKNDEKMLLFSYITEINGYIYDFSYSSLDSDAENKLRLFYSILQSSFIDKIRVMNPLKELKVTPVENIVY